MDDHGLVDLQGHQVVPATYPMISYFGEGIYIAVLRDPNDRFHFLPQKILLNESGAQIPVNVSEGTFLSGVCWHGKNPFKAGSVRRTLPEDALLIFHEKGKVGLCDTNGRIVLPSEYRYFSSESEMKVLAEKPGGAQVIFDVSTRSLTDILIQGKVSTSWSFSDGLIPFEQNGKWGFVDGNGKVAIPAAFHGVDVFNRGTALVYELAEDPKFSVGKFIDKTGRVVSPDAFSYLEFHGDYAVCAKSKGKVGLVDRNFKFVLPPEYSFLSPVLPERFGSYHCVKNRDQNPLFFHAQKGPNDPLVAISAKGKVLFELPSKVSINWLPELRNGVLPYKIWNDKNKPDEKILNTSGVEVDDPFQHFVRKGISFQKISPSRAIVTKEYPDELYRQKIESMTRRWRRN